MGIGAGKFVSRGANNRFLQGVAKRIFLGVANSGLILFLWTQTKSEAFSTKILMGKRQIYENSGSQGRPPLPLL